MGLPVAEIRAVLSNHLESVRLDEMGTALKVYEDAVGFLLERPGGNIVLSGETFSLRIPFSHDHPMFVGKSPEGCAELMKKIAGNENGGDFSLRSRYAIADLTRTQKIPTLTQNDQGDWEMEMELANDGPRSMIVPDIVTIGKPFERPQHSLSGAELVHIAAGFCPDETDHVRFLTKSNVVISFQDLLAQGKHAFHEDSEWYPVAVVLPYTEKVGIIKPDGPIDLATMKSRREGWVEENVDFRTPSSLRRGDNHRVVLKMTGGVVIVPEGNVLIIRQEGLQGEVPHGPSVVAERTKHTDGDYNWQIIGEHPFRTAGENVNNPTGFIVDVYRAA